MKTGILNRATEAKQTNEQKTAEEELKLGILSLSIDYRKNATNNETFKNFVTADNGLKLKRAMGLTEDYPFLTINNGIVTYKDVKYIVDDYGNVKEFVTNIPNGLDIGSIVTYTPIGTTYTWKGEYATDAEITIVNGKNTTADDVELNSASGGNAAITSWKVLDIDSDTETVKLVPANQPAVMVKLERANGYNNAVFLLNEACKTLYKNENLGITENDVRSINIEDISGDDIGNVDGAIKKSVVDASKGEGYPVSMKNAYDSYKNGYGIGSAWRKLSTNICKGGNVGNK